MQIDDINKEKVENETFPETFHSNLPPNSPGGYMSLAENFNTFCQSMPPFWSIDKILSPSPQPMEGRFDYRWFYPFLPQHPFSSSIFNITKSLYSKVIPWHHALEREGSFFRKSSEHPFFAAYDRHFLSSQCAPNIECFSPASNCSQPIDWETPKSCFNFLDPTRRAVGELSDKSCSSSLEENTIDEALDFRILSKK